MPYLVALARVRDYADWRRGFDERTAARRGRGIRGEQIFRNPDEPNEGLVIFDVEDVERELQYLRNPESQRARAQNGIVEFTAWVPES